jgi:hypothetical protein
LTITRNEIPGIKGGKTLADRVITTCEKELPRHSADCSGFVRAVCADLGVVVTGLANDIVNTIRAGGAWTRLADGVTAMDNAKAGKLVIAGLRGDEQAVPDAHGHVVVVVDGSLAFSRYPTAYWGQLHGSGGRFKTLDYAWTARDRDRITYAAHDLA